MFDAIAGRYDLLNRVLSVGLDRHWRARAIRTLNLTGRETVLDLCTGTADLALASMARDARARRVIGIDFAGAMLALGKKKIRAAGLERSISLARGDAIRIPLRDDSVDAVTIGFGIRNVERPVEAFREIVRVLRKNGTLAILEFSLPRAAVVRSLYLWYFRNVLPRVGRAIEGQAQPVCGFVGCEVARCDRELRGSVCAYLAMTNSTRSHSFRLPCASRVIICEARLAL